MSDQKESLLCLLCIYCNKNFSTKSNLNHHQKTAKFCLSSQGINDESFKCLYCLKILSTQSRLNSHLSICKVKIDEEKKIKENEKIKKRENKDKIKKYELSVKEYQIRLKENEDKLKENEAKLKENETKMIEEYEAKLKENESKMIVEYQAKLKENENKLREYISKLEDLLKEANQTIYNIAKQPKTIQTNTNSNNDNRIKIQNNLSQVFDINDIKKINNVLEKHLTPDVLSKGQKGIAEMLKEHLLQNEKGELIYECTDVSRQKFEFINTYGFIEPDPKAIKLLKSLSDANIFDMAHLTGKKLWETENGIDYDAQHVHMPKVGEVLEINMDSSKLRSHLANITTK